jgi:hypothetical protein
MQIRPFESRVESALSATSFFKIQMPEEPKILAHPQQPEEAGIPSSWVSLILRFIVIYFGVQYMTSSLSSTASSRSTTSPNPISSTTFAPKWYLGLEGMTLSVYISEFEEPKDVFEGASVPEPDWKVDDIKFGGWQDEMKHELLVQASEALMSNGSIYLHAFIAQAGIEARDFNEQKKKVLVLSRQLNYYLPRKKIKATKSLLDKADGEVQDVQVEEEDLDTSLVSYWWPNVFSLLLIR